VQLKKYKVKVFDLAPPATQTELLGDFEFEDMKGDFTMSSTFMIETPFMSSNSKSPRVRLCRRRCQVKYLHFGIFQLHTKRLGERVQTGLVAQ